MKTNELRVGNWLQRLDGSFFQVSLYDFQVITELIERWHPSPINITEEWLVKFGFKYIELGDEVYEQTWCYNGLQMLWGPSSDNYFYHDFYRGGVVKHVNQLQNLYFALTGEELTIK
jgi:hypothetical protein